MVKCVLDCNAWNLVTFYLPGYAICRETRYFCQLEIIPLIPYNRTLVIFILGLLSTIGPFAIDMYLPGFPAIAKDLRQNPSLVKDHNYLNSHAELREFLNSHPGVRQELKEDPSVFMKREHQFEKHEKHEQKFQYTDQHGKR